MQVRIHRGTHEIGGTCIELAAQGSRLLLDLGLPLDGDPEDTTKHPMIDHLDGSGDLLALVLSHGHVDHWGLAHLAGPDLPVALGAATHRILKAAAPFVPRPYLPVRTVELAIPVEPLMRFVGRPLREFHQATICGGLAFTLTGGVVPVRAVVPMSFQSALAGIMLAAELVKHAAGWPEPAAVSTRINLLRPLGQHLHDPIAPDPSGRCICNDPDFKAAYELKYAPSRAA